MFGLFLVFYTSFNLSDAPELMDSAASGRGHYRRLLQRLFPHRHEFFDNFGYVMYGVNNEPRRFTLSFESHPTHLWLFGKSVVYSILPDWIAHFGGTINAEDEMANIEYLLFSREGKNLQRLEPRKDYARYVTSDGWTYPAGARTRRSVPNYTRIEHYTLG